jgi:hypothetical protein
LAFWRSSDTLAAPRADSSASRNGKPGAGAGSGNRLFVFIIFTGHTRPIATSNLTVVTG